MVVLRLTFRLLTTFCQPEYGLCVEKTRAGKLWVVCGGGMERSGLT
jgi:hypothetical protein